MDDEFGKQLQAVGGESRILGLKVFTDAHMPVTHEEGDRYPLGPPSFVCDHSSFG